MHLVYSKTASLPLLPGPLWPRVVVPDSPIYGSNRIVWQFKLRANKWLILNWIIKNITDHLTVSKQMSNVD